MEQTIWLYFGIVTVIIAFGIVARLVADSNQSQKDALFDRALESLEGRCRFVCDSPTMTKQSVQVNMPSGLVLQTQEENICGDYKEERRCVSCECEMRPYKLDLNTTIALETFETHEYRCYFTRGEDDITMECKG